MSEFFSTAATSGLGMRRPVLKSMGSSSSTSLEVSEIFDGVRRLGQDSAGDESGAEAAAIIPEVSSQRTRYVTLFGPPHNFRVLTKAFCHYALIFGCYA